MIQAALNGRRTRTEHPGIPVTPEELAKSAKESIAAGAACIHFHVRGADGKESLDSSDVARALTTIRALVPGTPLGVSTGAWILQDVELRHLTISQWTVLPDFASVNFKETGAVPLAELLLSRGVAVEAGLSDLWGAQAFVANNAAPESQSLIAKAVLALGFGGNASVAALASRCLRILLEPFEDSSEAALENVQRIGTYLDEANVRIPCMLHGLNQTAWLLIDEAAARGCDTRVGFEDTLTMPDGSAAPGNGALVAEAARRMRPTVSR